MTRSDYYSAKEAAEVVLCSISFIYQLIKQGKLPDYRVGSRHYIPVTAVNDYIKNQAKGKEEV